MPKNPLGNDECRHGKKAFGASDSAKVRDQAGCLMSSHTMSGDDLYHLFSVILGDGS